MDYKELVVKSFRLAWQYKWLWVFGVFVGGGGGFGGNFGGNFGSNFNYKTDAPWSGRRPGPHWQAFGRVLQNWISDHIALIVALVIAFLLLLLVWLILSIISQGALIGAGRRLDDDEPTGFAESFQTGVANFWSILGFGLLLFLIIAAPIFVLALVIAAAFAFAGPLAFLGFILFIPLILLLISAALAIGIINMLGTRFIIIEGRGAVAALAEAWRLLWRRLGSALLTWLISVALALGFGIVVALALVILLVPTAIAGFFVFRAGFSLVKLAVFIFIGLAILAALVVAQGAFGAYHSLYWTLAFRRIRALE